MIRLSLRRLTQALLSRSLPLVQPLPHVQTLLVLLLMPLSIGTAVANDQAPRMLPVQQTAGVQPQPYAMYPGQAAAQPGYPTASRPVIQPGYPYLNAPLYPSPQPNIPVQVGSTVITNQALYPHEMLYPHDYDAIYPPYYHQVKGHFIQTPFGTKSDERWELLGTKVKVRYRSAIPFWTGFHAPHRSYFDYDRNWNNSTNNGHYFPNRGHH